MTRAFTLVVCMLFSCNIFSQVLSGDLLNHDSYRPYPPNNPVSLVSSAQNADRGVQEIVIDYSIADESNGGFIWWLNSHYDNDSFKLNHATTVIDSFFDVVSMTTVPYESIDSYSIDTFTLWGMHHKYTPKSVNDTLIVSIVKLDGSLAPPDVLTANDVIWSDTVVTDTVLTQPNTVEPISFAPNLMITDAEKVGLRIDYYSDVQDSFAVQILFRDSCTAQGAQQRYCAANLSRFWGNTWYKWYLGQYSGYTSNMPGLYFDCNQSGGYTLGNCEAYYMQNLRTQTSMTVHQSFHVATSQDAIICKGATFNLDAQAMGGSGSYTYEWGPNYKLVNPNAANTVASPDTSTSYSVKVIDTGTNDTIIKTVSVTVIDVQVDLGLDDTIECGDSRILLPSISGTSNASYKWFKNGNQISGATFPTLTVRDRGLYKLEVLDNDFNCLVSDNIKIELNTAQYLSFNFSGDVCDSTSGSLGRHVTFDNTSTEQTGWNWRWDFDDGSGFNTLNSPLHIYTSPGNYKVTLTATNKNDPNCILEHTQSLNMKQVCVGIDDPSNGLVFSIQPNPSSGVARIRYERLSSTDIGVSVIDIQGRTLIMKEYGNAHSLNETIDLSELSDGLYFIKLSTGTESLTKKLSLVKQ